MDNIPLMLPIKEAAPKSGLTYDHIRKLCLNDEITYIRAGSGKNAKYLINMDKLAQYLNGEH